MMPQLKAAALRAVELHEKDLEAPAMLGVVAGALDYDWWEALRQCRLALACEPTSPTASQCRGQVLGSATRLHFCGSGAIACKMARVFEWSSATIFDVQPTSSTPITMISVNGTRCYGALP
jgi:hypothetical protein